MLQKFIEKSNVTYSVTEDALREFAKFIIAQVREQDAAAAAQAAAAEQEVDIHQVAKMLGKSENTLWRWEKQGYLIPHRRVGKTPMYRMEDIKKLG